MFSTKTLHRIKKEIEKQFPEFKGIKPKVIEKKIAPQKGVYKKLSLSLPEETRTVFSLRYERKIKTADAIAMKQILIVTADNMGRIIKISQSK